MATKRQVASLDLRAYLRVSKDASGEERSPNEQWSDLQADSEAEGFTLHASPYRDIGSASRYAGKARTNFDRMVRDLESGEFEADGLALWEPSRGSRKVSEWARLIETLAERKLGVWVHTDGRLYDLSRARDRKDLQDAAVDAEYESGKTSERQVRSQAARAARGGAAGRLSFAQVSEYDPKSGKLVRRSWDEEKGQLVIDAFRAVDKGKSLFSIEKKWLAEGVLNGRGKPFTGNQIREVLRNRTYIGDRVHVPGQIIRWYRANPEDVMITKGDWEPLLKLENGDADRDLFFRVQDILSRAERVTTRPGGARHLMSMTAKCAVCTGPIAAGCGKRGSSTYRCGKGCVSVQKALVDEFATDLIVGFLSREDEYASLEHGDGGNVELHEAQKKLADIDAHYQSMKSLTRQRKMSPEAFAEMEPGVLADLATAQQRVDMLRTPLELREFFAPGDDVRERFEECDIAAQRQIVAYVFSPGRLGEFRIKKSPTPGHIVPIEQRVEFFRPAGAEVEPGEAANLVGVAES
ncbi:recombinase family protein [Amycolatopsis roodepoortensis]|uniref:recombinase family protein n=1 Tax=Amycolatopsis roodepoortensis TaxID=700274 RepID=UPI00214CF8B7|nr:recombinase family protein [Amycolatopsis roodepoortensis]UUV29108.1 recombinase family protein [Amycolatopsis roodepoortensis]